MGKQSKTKRARRSYRQALKLVETKGTPGEKPNTVIMSPQVLREVQRLMRDVPWVVQRS